MVGIDCPEEKFIHRNNRLSQGENMKNSRSLFRK